MTQEQTLIENPTLLSLEAMAALSRALQLMALCKDPVPPDVAAYVMQTFRDAATPDVVAALFDQCTKPPPEPKRPRLTAPVRRGLQAMAGTIDTRSAHEDVLRAAKWIAEECGHE